MYKSENGMRRLAIYVTLFVLALGMNTAGLKTSWADSPKASGLGDPGKLERLTVEFGLPQTDSFVLAGVTRGNN